jgi:hypothetical protein
MGVKLPVAEINDIYREEHQKPITWDDMQVSEEVFNERISICNGCEFWVENEVGVGYDYATESYESTETVMQCSKCNCDMNIKANHANVKCPIDKW